MLFVPVALAACGLARSLSACSTGETWFYYADADAGADPGTDAGLDAGPDPRACPPGACVPIPPNFDGPLLLWPGPHDVPFDSDSGAPDCPTGRPKAWGDGLVAPSDCLPCSCGTPIGSCELPSTLIAHDVLCQGLNQPHTDIPFDARAAWDGGCDKMNPVGAGAGVQSLSIESVTVKQEHCAVGPLVPANFSPYHWTTDARTCHAENLLECNGDRDSRCIDRYTPPSGFHLCVSYAGEIDCNGTNPWTEKYFFYGQVADNRSCSACACGAPVGSACESTISAYTDGECKTLQNSAVVKSAPNFCVNIPPGVALGSKSATPPSYIPGYCVASGGIPDGGAESKAPTTFCCLP